MELFLILLKQIAIMALLAAVGVYLSRAGFLSAQGTKDLGAILLRVVIPCVIVKSYITQFSRERLVQLALSAGLALLGFVLAMAITGPPTWHTASAAASRTSPRPSATPGLSASPWPRR